MIKNRFFIFLLFLVFFVTSGCATVYNPVTMREELTLINTETEKALGANISRQIENEFRLVKQKNIVFRVKEIGNSVAVYSGRSNIYYRFEVIDEDKMNAISLPGGYIYVFRSLVEEVSDDELANVIAHEIAHVEARHSVKRLQTVLGYNLLISLAFRGEDPVLVRYSNIIFDLILKGYSRYDELQADERGVELVRIAGYDPEGMISLLKKLKDKDKFSQYRIEFLSTHPSYENRIENLKEIIRRLP